MVGCFEVHETVDSHLHLLFIKRPLVRLSTPELLGNLAIELVDLSGIDPISDPGQPRLQSGSIRA